MKHLLSIHDLTPSNIEEIMEQTRLLKASHNSKIEHFTLRGKTLGMIFEKASTRTRLSFEVGMAQLGGTTIFINTKETQIARGEDLCDTAKIFSCYLDAVVIRTFAQKYLEDFAKYASIPIINGLTDLLHPCQILSDIFTIEEKFGTYEGLKIAYIGDGNNIANSWINLATKLSFELALACPIGYLPDEAIFERGLREAKGKLSLTQDPFAASQGADVIYTDVWTSMGQEEEKERREHDFAGYQVNEKILQTARPSAIVMHCLPAHRGEEISAAVIDGRQSVIFVQAENRLHLQKAILEMLILGG